MKNYLSRISGILLVFGATALAGNQPSPAQNTNSFFSTYIYQGVLSVADDWGSNPGPDDAPNRLDLSARLVNPGYVWDPENPWPTNCPNCSGIELGINSITLDKGGRFSTPIVIPQELLASVDGLYLEFAVRSAGDAEFTTLSPLQPLSATPYATIARSVSGPIPASSLTGVMPTGMLTGVFSSPLTLSNPANVFVGDGALLANINATTLGGFTACDLPCFWKLEGNENATADSFLGTRKPVPLTIGVNNKAALRVYPDTVVRTDVGSLPEEPVPASPNIVGGFYGNLIHPDTKGATIAGGGSLYDHSFHSGPGQNEIGRQSDYSFLGSGSANHVKGPHNSVVGGHYNRIVDGNYCVIAGGGENLITAPVDGGAIVAGLRNKVVGNTDTNFPSGDLAFIGAGHDNTATNFAAFIGGGGENFASGKYSVVAGGYGNQVAGAQGAVGGGKLNVASGIDATVPGGIDNTASGVASLAAGSRAKAEHDGSFVWSDSQNSDFASTAENQFAVRAQNGVMIQGTSTALDLRGDGAIRVAGAGVASHGPVFIHRATAGTITGHITTIDHPLANGDPNAILLVTHNYSADTSATPYEPNTVGVWYNGSRWTIYHEETGIPMPVGRAFNVMIIKP